MNGRRHLVGMALATLALVATAGVASATTTFPPTGPNSGSITDELDALRRGTVPVVSAPGTTSILETQCRLVLPAGECRALRADDTTRPPPAAPDVEAVADELAALRHGTISATDRTGGSTATNWNDFHGPR